MRLGLGQEMTAESRRRRANIKHIKYLKEKSGNNERPSGTV